MAPPSSLFRRLLFLAECAAPGVAPGKLNQGRIPPFSLPETKSPELFNNSGSSWAGLVFNGSMPVFQTVGVSSNLTPCPILLSEICGQSHRAWEFGC